MNRLELRQLSRLRIEEGKCLLDAGHYAGSYYLSGYSVECALKAVIAGQRGRHEFPGKHFAVACNTHNLYTLVKLARLELELAIAIRASAAFRENWTAVLRWSEIARYTAVVPANLARCMYVACANQRGTTMDTDVLVEGTMASGMVDCGRQLLHELDRDGLHPDSMYWEYDEECREWFLQIITRRMDTEDNFKVIRRVHKAIDSLPEVEELLRPSYFVVRGVKDPGYQVSRQRMPYGRGASNREWANRDFYCYRLS